MNVTVYKKEPGKNFELVSIPFKRLTPEFRKTLKSTSFFQYGVPYLNLVAYFARKDERSAKYNVSFYGQPIYGAIIFTGCDVTGGEIRDVTSEDVEIINSSLLGLNSPM